MKNTALIILLLISAAVRSQSFTTGQYKEDFSFFWQTVNDNYCYFEKKQIDWNKVKEIYGPQIDTITSRASFISILENALYELYDHHCSLRTRNPFSRRLVPTGADIWAEFEGDRPLVKEVRKGFGAEKAGITAGMEVVAVNDIPVNRAILPFLGHTVNTESKSFALRLLLAGDHLTKRKITLRSTKGIADYYPDQDGLLLEDVQYPAWVESGLSTQAGLSDRSGVFGQIGYIKVNNFLFDNKIIPLFDSVLNTMMQKKALILDLRETPSGGNTTVARAILGRFIGKEQFYQKHEFYAEEKATGIKRSWEEIVSPRGPVYTGKLVVIADHWNGSIGEGITIAFDGMKRATIVGTELARLNGAVDGFEMPNTKIGFNIATERLYHVDGTPREFFEPAIPVQVAAQTATNDIILRTAIDFLQARIRS